MFRLTSEDEPLPDVAQVNDVWKFIEIGGARSILDLEPHIATYGGDGMEIRSALHYMQMFNLTLHVIGQSFVGLDTVDEALLAAGDRERGSILSAAMRHTKWLDSFPMRAVLSGPGFDLRDLKRKPMTVYVVIPPEELDNHKRFLRLFVTLGLAAMTREPTRPKHRILFLMDEFPALERLEAVRVGINVIRSYGIILWPIIQNIGQLIHLYGKDAETFLDATGAVQVFSVGGQETASFIPPGKFRNRRIATGRRKSSCERANHRCF